MFPTAYSPEAPELRGSIVEYPVPVPQGPGAASSAGSSSTAPAQEGAPSERVQSAAQRMFPSAYSRDEAREERTEAEELPSSFASEAEELAALAADIGNPTNPNPKPNPNLTR